MRQPCLAYNLLKFALQTYGRKPAELDKDEYLVVRKQAEAESNLQAKILASEQGLRAAVPGQAVQSALEAVAGRYASQEDFEDDLAASDLDLDSMAAALEVELIVEAAMAQVTAGAKPPSEELVTELFEAGQARQLERRQARHILITINDQFAENSRIAALARISKVRNFAVEPSRDFGELAARFSECPSSIQGGSLGAVGPGTLYPALDEALFAMTAGEISEVIESPMGFHVLLCEKIIAAKQADVEKIKAAISTKLIAKAQKKRIKAWLADLQQPGS